MGLAVAHLPRVAGGNIAEFGRFYGKGWPRKSGFALRAERAAASRGVQRIMVVVLAGLLRLPGGIWLVEHPAVGQRKISEKDGRKENPSSGNMET
jgi:hypothetical protein